MSWWEGQGISFNICLLCRSANSPSKAPGPRRRSILLVKTGGPFASASGKSNVSFSNNELFEVADSIERYPASKASILKKEPDCLMACLPKVRVQSAISSFKESSAHTSTSNDVSLVNVLFAKSPSGPGGGDSCSTFASYTSFSIETCRNV